MPFLREMMSQVCAVRLMRHVREIAQYVRISGSPAEREAFRYIEQEMRSYGFDVRLLFHDAYISVPESASLAVTTPERRAIQCITHSFGLPTPEQGVCGELVSLGAGGEQDYSGTDVRGKFVLLTGMASPEAAQIATRHGALGVIHTGIDEQIHDMIVSNVWGNPDDQTKQSLPRVFVASISGGERPALIHLLERGPVHVKFNAKVETGWMKIPLLVADLPPNDPQGHFLLLSGHVDSWYYGAMDNGSANATMLEVSRLMAKERRHLGRGLRVCHSHGRYAGSAWYVDNHWEDLHKHCVMHLNTDSTGARGATHLKMAPVMAETRHIASRAVGDVTAEQFTGRRMARNGDQSFWGVGIPSLFVGLSTQSPDPSGLASPELGWWWHTPADLPDKIDPDNLVRDTKVYAHVCWQVLTPTVLPFDYRAHAEEWVSSLSELERESGGAFNLGDLIHRAERLLARLHTLYALQLHAGPESASIINECLMSLGRTLIPVNYTRSGRFSHDQALPLEPFPGLSDVRWLRDTGEHSDERKFMVVRLTRAANEARAALRAALTIVDEAINRLA